jgi:enoyl-CoA hydratase/carnithine racemase
MSAHSSPPSDGAEILCEIRNRLATVTLNRPSALNALSLPMVQGLRIALRDCAADPEVRAVLIRGAGEKAFCAGGDIRALYQSFKHSGSLHQAFFVAEYPLDYLMYSYPKPYIALLDGITMGGGMGISQGSTLRIVGDRTRIAMPEVGIGLFPDVGGSYFLSRLPGALGTYLALTGTQIRAADALYTQLADIYLPPAATAALATELDSIRWSADPHADVSRTLRALADPASPPAALPAPSLRPLRPAIDVHFAKPGIPAILASLNGEQRPEFSEWARQTAQLLSARSPTMLAVTHRQLLRGKSMSLAACLRMELGMIRQCFAQGDFIEGVRAMIVDKDNAPRWKPDRIEDVTDAMIDAFFQDPWSGAAHPLADLEDQSL